MGSTQVLITFRTAPQLTSTLPNPPKMSHKPPLEVGLWTLTLLDDIPAVANASALSTKTQPIQALINPRRKATVRKIFDVDHR